MTAERTRGLVEELGRAGVPGAQAYASVDGVAVLDVAFGSLGPDDATPLEPGDALPLFCAAKPIEAVAAGRLIDQGVLDLGLPLPLLFPELAGTQAADITVGKVLSHATGLQDDPCLRSPFTGWDKKVGAALTALVEEPLLGSSYLVAADWQLLGEIIARASGSPYAEAVEALVLHPLGLGDVALCLAGPTPGARRPFHTRKDDRAVVLRSLELRRVQQDRWPGLSTTAPIRALGRMYEKLLDARRGVANGFLTSATAERLTTAVRAPQWDEGMQRTCSWGGGLALADSGLLGRRAPSDAFGHASAGGAAMWASPSAGVVVGVAANCLLTEAEMSSLLDAVADDLAVTGRRR